MHDAVRQFARIASCVVIVTASVLAGAEGREPSRSGTGLPGIVLGRPAPDILFDIGAGPTRLSTLRGRPVVLNFWASWCRPCLDELPDFERLQREYGDRVRIVTMSMEEDGAAKRLLAARGSTLPLSEDVGGGPFKAFGIGPIPVTVVVRPQGDVEYVSVGQLDWHELHTAVDQAARP